ncbi:hypothetical protein [Thioalkalivibrio sulfidiphilus]|uniref:hypothetical protein n=1 Tax=Thioalkalivibrio sulfidiphilus TaxID=1033854 RepID=UPI003B34A985
MTPSEARRRARAIRAAARTAGCVVVIQDGQGRLHALPGRAEVVGTYDGRANLEALADDLIFLAHQARTRDGRD